jgi:hypothetical protein
MATRRALVDSPPVGSLEDDSTDFHLESPCKQHPPTSPDPLIHGMHAQCDASAECGETRLMVQISVVAEEKQDQGARTLGPSNAML